MTEVPKILCCYYLTVIWLCLYYGHSIDTVCQSHLVAKWELPVLQKQKMVHISQIFLFTHIIEIKLLYVDFVAVLFNILLFKPNQCFALQQILYTPLLYYTVLEVADV